MQKHLSLIKWKIISISLGLGLLFWIIDSFVDVFLFHEGTLKSQIFTPDSYEIYVRLTAASLFLFFSFIAQYLTNRFMHANELLKEGEEKYRLLFHSSPVGVIQYSKDLIVTEFNRRFAEIVRLSPEQLRGYDMKMTQVESMNSAFNVAINGEEGFYEGNCHLSPVPSESWVTLRTAPLFDAQGKIKGGIGIVEDITVNRKNLMALEASEARYKNLFDNAHDLIQSIAPDGHILYVNPAWLNTMGYTPEELSRMTIFDILHPEHKTQCMNTLKNVMSGGSKENIEAVFISKDGRVVNLEGNASVRLVDGTAVACNGIFRDITERKKMDEQIFQINQDWEDTFNIITDMITVHDADFNIIRYNTAAEKMLGLSFLNIKKEKCYQFYHGTECPPAGCPSCLTFKTGVPATVELFEPHLNMFIEIRAIPRLDSEHNIIGLIHVVRDITEHRKLESELRQSQKMEAVGQLAGGVAHDFNNIITAIIGYASIMKMKAGDDYLRGLIDNVLSASERAAALVRSLLAFSRKQISHPEPIRINEAIKGIEKLLSMAVGEDIELKELTEDLIVTADIVQMEQVMMNLCSNARDAMSGRGALTIKTGAAELTGDFIAPYGYGEEGRFALISVSDTGVGMNEKTMERIFEPFFTTKEVGKGTGLGLSIVYGIIKQHKGYITCQSEPGKGTTFNIYLPVIKAAMKEVKRIEQSEPAGSAVTILFAEDEEKFRKLTRQMLESSGYNVIEAVDGADAVNKFKENNDIDLLLFDIIMPRMSGKEAYEKIRKIRPDVKALFISGYPDDFIDKYGVFKEGMNFISKPVPPSALLRKIREVLGNERAE